MVSKSKKSETMPVKTSGSRSSREGSKLDSFKWLLIVLLIAGAIVANSYYSHIAWALRAAAGIVLAIIVLAIASQTAKGKSAWVFIKGSRAELRKVVWPTRQETIQTTLVVIVMVIVAAILLWGLDSVLVWLVGWLTGQRG